VTNLDAAPAGRDTQVLCLDPTAALSSTLGRAFRVAVAVELQILRGRGTRVDHVTPDDEAAEAMGTEFMATGRVAAGLAAGYGQGRRLAAS
jgi:NTE family protein